MNYKTILMASAAVLFTTQAMAEDITNPFFTPAKGQFTSDTSIEYAREKMDSNDVMEDTSVAETLEYGITDEISVNATIANFFDTEGDYNNDHNFVYQLGAKYTTQYNNIWMQAAVNYLTYEPQSWLGRSATNDWYKELGGEVKVGYELCNGLTPYMSYTISGNIDDSNRELDQSVKAAVYKNFGKYALDLGLRYNFNTDGKNTNDLWAEAKADYYLTDNLALGVFGAYQLDGTDTKDVDYNYTAGAHVKVLF